MESVLSDPRSGLLPVGLHVLAVDHDLAALDILEKMLMHCSYQVTTCQSAEDALSLLRENNTRFDMLMTEIQLPTMSGVHLLAEALKLPINLPVILFSADLDHDTIKEILYSGASYVLSKPIPMNILTVMWQLAFGNTGRFDFGEVGSVDPVLPIKGSEEIQDNNPSYSGQEESVLNNSNISDADINKKKSRFSWTEERHNLFVEALKFLDNDKVIPSKIWNYMQRRQQDPYLTRHVIASHLQKFRGKNSKKQDESGAPYWRDTIQHKSPLMYTGTQMRTTSHIPPVVSSIQPTYLDQGTMYMECFHEPNPIGNIHRLQPSYELQQNAVGFGYNIGTVPQSKQHLSFQDMGNQGLEYGDYEQTTINEAWNFPTDAESSLNTWLDGDYQFLEEHLVE